MSISGEDHGLKSIGKWTKAVKAVTAAREDGREEEKRLDNHHPQADLIMNTMMGLNLILLFVCLFKFHHLILIVCLFVQISPLNP